MKQITCPHCADTYPDFDAAHVCSKGPYAPRLKPKMNERIAKLYDQAIIIEDGGDYVCGELDPEKFARLIIQECTEVTADWYKNHNQYHMPPDEHIKAHFGVES